MKLLSGIFLFGVLWHQSSTSCISDGDNLGRSDFTVGVLSDALLSYTLKQYKTMVAEQRTENVFTSPYSIWSALSTLYQGSRQKSSDELQELLGLQGLRKSAVEEQSKGLELAIQSNGQDVFSVGNLIALDGFTQRERQCIVKDKSLPITSLNFSGEPEKSRIALNTWAESKTNGKIQNVFPPGSIGPDTRMVIMNAVYFKGEWKYKFKPDTSPQGQQFTSSTGKVTNVPMMTLKTDLKFNLDDSLGVQAVELPYSSGKYSMVMMLPKPQQTVDGLMEKLDDKTLKNFLGGFFKTKVNVKMPKFKLETSYKLKKVLMNLGAKTMFQSANISGILETSQNIRVSDVVHKAFIEVNEEGTEAAAVTAIKIVSFSLLSERSLTFDRPFVFLLKNTETNAVLFMGVVKKL